MFVAAASLGALVSAAARVRTLCCGFSACVFALVLNIISIILSMLYGKEKESVMMPAWGLFRENGTFAHKTADAAWGLFRENSTFAHKMADAACGLFRKNGTFAHKTADAAWGLFRKNGTFAHKTAGSAKHRQQKRPAGWRVIFWRA